MFVTKGPVDPESRLFVGRARELNQMESWLREANCVGAVLGARQTGKTSLLLKLRHTFRDKYAFAYVNLQAIDGADVAECLSFIADESSSQLSGRMWGAPFSLPSNNRELRGFLKQLAATVQSVRIVILLDEIGALPLETALKLSSAIRAVFTDRLINPELSKYLFLLAGASDMLEVATGRNSPLRNVTESIYLGDFSLLETEELLGRAFENAPGERPLDIHRSLYYWTSGHPYWTQLLGASLSSQDERLTDDALSRHIEELIRTEDKNLPHIFQILQADDGLWKLVEFLLDGGSIGFSRANSVVAKLELIGLLKNENGRCTIRNKIYRQAIERLWVRELRAPENRLRALTRRIFAANSINSLLHEVIEHIQQTFQIRSSIAFVRGSGGAFVPEAHMAVPASVLAEVMFEPRCHLLEVPEAVFMASEKSLPESEKCRLEKIGCSLVVPLRARGEPLGFLVLGPRFSGAAYDPQDLELLEAIGDQTAAAIDRIRLRGLEEDARLALDIQRGLLPKILPEVEGFEIAGTWRPAQLVSGDYYDVFRVSADSFALCIADVAGKGMAAALLMANLQAAVRTIAAESCAPKDLCAEVNRLICGNIAPGKFITFFYALLNLQSREMTYTNAGHSAPIILRDSGEVLRLSGGGAVLGVFSEGSYNQAQFGLEPGDVFLAFTDGVSEAQNSVAEEYGEERLIALMKTNQRASPASLQHAIVSAVSEFTAFHFHDDVTLVGLKVTGTREPA